MKKIIFLCTVLMCLCLSVASAEYSGETQIQKFLPNIAGDWTDSNGHRGIHISGSGNGINTFRFMDLLSWDGDDRDGTAVIRVMEKRDARDMKVVYHRDGANSYLILDDRVRMVPKTGEKQHVESVGGVKLDMTLMDLLRLYGPPTEDWHETTTKGMLGVKAHAWYYKNDGWAVTFDKSTNTVDRIYLMTGSTKFLDNVVLNADSPLEKFSGYYGFSKVPAAGDVFDLGQQEYLHFLGYPRFISLSIYAEEGTEDEDM